MIEREGILITLGVRLAEFYSSRNLRYTSGKRWCPLTVACCMGPQEP